MVGLLPVSSGLVSSGGEPGVPSPSMDQKPQKERRGLLKFHISGGENCLNSVPGHRQRGCLWRQSSANHRRGNIGYYWIQCIVPASSKGSSVYGGGMKNIDVRGWWVRNRWGKAQLYLSAVLQKPVWG